ncbi:hypothetical protein GOBAR_AA04092 [Gossypium barbadense]|uniref:DCD domain-containing protein n=1 Tax=Gossypium barbadense TaxID=3634 RepID=A0A2P5YLS5_GOSBA|nr:hypothetical protein GOBAR_AA04092 [Gossypium barbadense]
MERANNFWQLGDDLRGLAKVAEDHKWLMAASKLAEQTRTKGERMNNLDLSKGPAEMRTRDKFGFQEDNKLENLNFNMLNLDSKVGDNVSKSSFQNGLPPRYRDSVRAITPGLPLFLYNYTTHQLHGIFEAASFGGSNIDPTAWEDKKCKGESRFPAQVRIRIRTLCKALEEDAFRPVLHHYDGPKFRLELSIPELSANVARVMQFSCLLLKDFSWSTSYGTLDLLDLCEQAGSP